MKTQSSISFRPLANLVALSVMCSAFGAAEAGQKPKFDLPRIKAHGKPDDADAVPKHKFAVGDISPQGQAGVKMKKKDLVDYLALDPHAAWSSPLRGGGRDTTFVSFFVCGSAGTTLDVAGAKLVVHASDKQGYAQIKAGTLGPKGVTWREVGGPVKVEKFDGASLAALPVLTLRLDRAAHVWDIFVAGRLATAGLPLSDLPKGAARQFNLSAGAEGALVCGLIDSDENPLYEDANGNGIDDVFEKQQTNGLLSAQTTDAKRMQLAQQWQAEQKVKPPKSFSVQRPRPDDASDTKPKGKS